MTADELRGAPPAYEVRGLEVTLGGQLVLGPLDLEIARGAFMGILGPNGSGKTTLLRALTGGVKPSAGSVVLEGRPPGTYRAVELARLVGMVPQQFSLDFNFTVAEMVAMGRYAHSGRGFPRATAADAAIARSPDATAAAADGDAVAAALEATGLTALSERLVTELSGGERQRALIAQTLAQETPILLLDEPLNNLDLNHQLEIMQLLGRLHARGKTVVVVLHDLNMAAQYCNELVLLDHGRVAARGTPGDILDPRLILEVFRVRVAVHRQGQRPYLTPLWSKSREGLVEQRTARVHVIAGGGAASEMVEELVLYGFTPSVGVVSVFDTDYATAQRYELHVISAPPFQPFPPEAVQQLEAVVEQAQVVAVAPIFFGPGNLEPLRVALRAARAGKLVVLVDEPPIAQRDLSGGEATRLVGELIASGAVLAGNTAEIVEKIRRSAVS
jgi:iron complex transport system ATP-binding protein